MDVCLIYAFFFFKQETAYDVRISDWSSDVCSSDLLSVDDQPSGLKLGAAGEAGRIAIEGQRAAARLDEPPAAADPAGIAAADGLRELEFRARPQVGILGKAARGGRQPPTFQSPVERAGDGARPTAAAPFPHLPALPADRPARAGQNEREDAVDGK